MNWKYSILPIIVLLLYLLNVWAMSTRVEPYFAERFNIITPILEKAKSMTAEEQVIEMQKLDEKVLEIDKQSPKAATILTGTTPLFEKLTFGRPNCFRVNFIGPCGFYTNELMIVVQMQYQAAKPLPSPNPFQYATKYTIFDHIQKIITLMIEALLLSLLIGFSWSKKEQIKEFYAFSKFKIIMVIALFVVIMVPPMIYDDMFFAAPWIWYILAPPMLLENFFRGPSEWIGLILWWILMPIWFYTIASIIQKVGISK